MEENTYLGSNSPSHLETSLSQQWKYLPPMSPPFLPPLEEAEKSSMENNYLNTNSSLDESVESVLNSWRAKSSERKEFRRTSLYRQFDPLHSPSEISDNNPDQDHDTSKKPNLHLETFNCEPQKSTVISNLSNFSSENALISFESPKNIPMIKQKYAFSGESVATKKYTEKEFNQILQDHELRLQGEFLRKHHDLEMTYKEKNKALEDKLSQITKVNKWYFNTLSHITNFLENMSSYNMELEAKIMSTKNENEDLEKDIAASKEDLAEWESTFAEFLERYEQCKNMLKSYKENMEKLLIKIESLQRALEEKDNMYNLLEVKSQEIMDKAQMEMDKAKKSANAGVAMLEVRLKKAEMKIYTLKNAFEQAMLQNEGYHNICKDLISNIKK